MKRKPAKKKTHRKTHTHELVFALALAVLVSSLGLYAYIQMFTFRVTAASHP